MNGQEAQKNSVALPSISAETMDLVLEYLYGKEPNFTRDTALDVARAANYLQLNQLRINAVNAYFKTYQKSHCNFIVKGLQNLEEFTEMCAPGERYDHAYLLE